MPFNVAELQRRLGVVLPRALVRAWRSPPRELTRPLYRPDADAADPMSLDAALAALATSVHTVWKGLVPLTFVDDRSLACVVCSEGWDDIQFFEGHVVRWHLDDIPPEHQAAQLDTDAWQYVVSLAEELGEHWDAGYAGMVAETGRYQQRFISQRKTSPKSHDLRPFQLACQNVIIGLAAMRYDPSIDGHSVKYWQTCEVPHVATNEGNRALAAVMLCDAFQSGGTMEIDFRAHPEQRVPASLRRYGRSVGVPLGEEDSSSVSPGEARKLFQAVTPMPEDLRDCVERIVGAGIISPERLCYSLLAPIWSAIELEFILRCSSRAASILRGGAQLEDRVARRHELEVARAAAMVGMLFRRLDAKDSADGSEDPIEARVFEDTSNGVQWRILDDLGAVEFHNLPAVPLPWRSPDELLWPRDGRVTALPRSHPLPPDFDALHELAQTGSAVLVVPRDDELASQELAALRCPDRLGDIDARIERNLSNSRLIRA